jgi:hypothetical protein
MSLVAALLVGLALGGLSSGPRDDGAQLPTSRTPARLLSAAALGSLQLTPACLPGAVDRRQTASASHVRPALELLAQLDVGELACCTLCHASGGAAADIRQATLRVSRSCSVCHTAGQL